jgi:hypothetical protein
LNNASIGVGVKTFNLSNAKFNNKVGKITVSGATTAISGGNAKICSIDRLGVLLQGEKDSVKIKPENLVIFPPNRSKQFLSLEEIKSQHNESEKSHFLSYDTVKISGLPNNTTTIITSGSSTSSSNGKESTINSANLNGREGTIVRMVGSFNGEDTSYLVKLKLQQSSHVEASIAGKYLTRVKEMYKNKAKHAADVMLKSNFFTSQKGAEFLHQLQLTGGGFTLVADPVYREGLELIVSENMFGKDKTPMYKKVLNIARHEKGEKFRQFVLKMKNGLLTSIDLNEALKDKDFKGFYETLIEMGLLRPRVAG